MDVKSKTRESTLDVFQNMFIFGFVGGVIHQQGLHLTKESQIDQFRYDWIIALSTYIAFGGYKEWNDPSHRFNVLTMDGMNNKIAEDLMRSIPKYRK